ncbi:hypothetical protein [Aeromicrobium sp.]|uniref:hypothetical protein n=1 Tax=Aeromicrobium sp. TaxID=1871063 RepID=UPI003D6B9E48
MTVHQQDAVQTHRSKSTMTAVAVCLLGAVLAAATIPVIGNTFAGTDGQAITERAIDNTGRLQLLSIISVYAGAALIFAAVRLARRVGGMAGQLIGGSGVAIAVLLVAYNSAFTAVASVGSFTVDSPSAGLAEAGLVVANALDLARFAPGLVLVVAASYAKDAVPKPLRILAIVLAVATVFPMTTWAAAMAIPVWMGIAGAFASPMKEAHH